VKCTECSKYAEYLTESGKQHPPFLGGCLPFRRNNEVITTVCNVPLHEKGEFEAWLNGGRSPVDGGSRDRDYHERGTLEDLEIERENHRE
jgi:hypothetical protein